jgi:hypothetical protein
MSEDTPRQIESLIQGLALSQKGAFVVGVPSPEFAALLVGRIKEEVPALREEQVDFMGTEVTDASLAGELTETVEQFRQWLLDSLQAPGPQAQIYLIDASSVAGPSGRDLLPNLFAAANANRDKVGSTNGKVYVFLLPSGVNRTNVGQYRDFMSSVTQIHFAQE